MYKSRGILALLHYIWDLHTVNMPFKCKQCDYSTKIVQNLNRHFKKHSGEKHFKCNQCNFASSRTDKLKEHMIRGKHQTGKKTYKCDHCDFESESSCNVAKHMRTHYRNKNYKCNMCDYATHKAFNLRRHERTKHQEEMDVDLHLGGTEEQQIERLARRPYVEFVTQLLNSFPPNHIPQEKWLGRTLSIKKMILLYHTDKVDKDKHGERYYELCDFITKQLTKKL